MSKPHHPAGGHPIGRHRSQGRASWLATLWRLLTGDSPLRSPCVPAAAMLAQLARPARGVVPTYPRVRRPARGVVPTYPRVREASA